MSNISWFQIIESKNVLLCVFNDSITRPVGAFPRPFWFKYFILNGS